MRLPSLLLRATACGLIAMGTSAPTQAALTLTPAGVDLGFTLTTFIGGYFGAYGPLSAGVLPNGNVLTGSMLGSQIYVFKDVDGQTLSDAVSSTSYGCETSNCNYSIARTGGQVYGAQAFGGIFYKFDASGGRTPIPNLQTAGVFGYLGMWGDPVNGHLIATSNRGLIDIDPSNGDFRVVNASLFPDGITVSKDGKVVYAEVGGGISSYDMASGALIKSFATGHSPDGTGVITGGPLDGFVVVNSNDGTVGLLDPSKADGDPKQFRIIAEGGTRGDFVSPDPSNGTLFLSQYDQMARLSCGAHCSIGSTTVPEPSTWAFLLSGLAVVGVAIGRKR